MDSGSGSIQSSSGGDDQEYDSSRVESISSFLNPSTHFGSISINPTQNPIHPPQPPPPPSSFFDPNSSHHLPLDHSSPFSLSHSPPVPNTTLYNNNLDPVFWPNMNQTILTTSQSGFSGPSPFPGTSTAARVPTPSDHRNVGVVAKNPKKRTRASRRAPTTVLTTDTSNFRQMVQEFTGIPAAPFSAGSSPFSRRLDLFGGGCSVMGVGPLYPLRPSAQKLQLSPQYNLANSSSTTSPSFLNSDATTTTTTNNSIATDHQGFPKQPQSLLNLQNQSLFSFQSLLQQQPLPNAATYSTQSDYLAGVGSSSMNNSLDGQHEVNPNLGGFPSSSTTTRWRDHQGSDQVENLGQGFDSNSQNVKGYKLSSTDHFNGEKGLENVVDTSRGNDHQGNHVDSWICPSD